MKLLGRAIATAVAVVGLVVVAYLWLFCRFYVDVNQMAIITAKTGRPMAAGQILAKPGEMGIQEKVLGEGRHFRDPFLFDREVRPVIVIPPGRVGIVTSKIGANLPEGEFLAGPGQKGIWRQVLGPGKYRVNPYGYQVDIVDAISIPIGYAGVITSLSGEQAPEGRFAGPNQKGIREDILHPGLYYANPKEFQVAVLEIGVNQVSLLGREGGAVITKAQIDTQNVAMEALQSKVLQEQKQQRLDYMSRSRAFSSGSQQADRAPGIAQQTESPVARKRPAPQGAEQELGLSQYVEFPSRDGFEISLDLTVEFELLPSNIAAIYRNYGDLPAVVDKIILPQILSISRNKGSEYRAKDFIIGEGREKFQRDLTEALATTLMEKNIIIHNALIRHVGVPGQILDPIQKASIALEQDLTNKQKQQTARQLALLNTENSIVEQRRQQVMQETEKLKAETRADQETQVARIQAETQRKTAEIARETAAVRAGKTRTLGGAEAEAVKLVAGERANGAALKTAAFGDPRAFALWEFAENLNPDIKINILHTGPGTLWTDLAGKGLVELGAAESLRRKQNP